MTVCTLNMNRTWHSRQSSTSQDDSDDSDLDIKRDILEGMTQAANYVSRCSATSTTETITTTSPVSISSATTSRNSDVHEHKLRRRTGEATKSRLLMPDLMENSETESAKNSGGSMESEAEPPSTTTESSIIMPPPPSGDGPFPSLPDVFLQKLELHSNLKERSEPLSDSEIEIRFNSLCLAFKTDRFTLTSRLELHQRQRDLAEKNVSDEINALKENLNVLSQICADEETRELVKRLHHHLEVLLQSTSRMSSRAEVYGAVQQEERTNRAIEAMLLHVENLKRINEKAVNEVEELKRILAENNLLPEDGSEADDNRRSLRTYSVSSSGIGKPSSRRRASIAALPRSSTEKMDGKMKFATFVANAASRNSVCNIGGRRCSLLPNLRPFSNFDRLNFSDKIKKTTLDDSCLPSTTNSNSENLEQDVAAREENSQHYLSSNLKLDLTSPTPLPSNHLSSVASSSPLSNGNVQLTNPSNAEKRKTALYLNNECEDNSSTNFENSSLEASTVWAQAKLIHNPYVTDASEQDDDDDEVGTDERHKIQHEYAAPIKQCSPYAAASSMFDVDRWMQNRNQIVGSVRYTLGGILLLAALLGFVFTFMPTSTTAAFECHSRSWRSVEELLRPYMALHHQARPPM